MDCIGKCCLEVVSKDWNTALSSGALRGLHLYKAIKVQTDFRNDSTLGQRSARFEVYHALPCLSNATSNPTSLSLNQPSTIQHIPHFNVGWFSATRETDGFHIPGGMMVSARHCIAWDRGLCPPVSHPWIV